MLEKLLPESRKLRVLLATVIGYILNAKLQWLAPDQVEALVQVIMVWLGGQSLADAGLQGKVIGMLRGEKKKPSPKAPEDAPEPCSDPMTEEGEIVPAIRNEAASDDGAGGEKDGEPTPEPEKGKDA